MPGHFHEWDHILKCGLFLLLTSRVSSIPFLSCEQPLYGFTTPTKLIYPQPTTDRGYGAATEMVSPLGPRERFRFIPIPETGDRFYFHSQRNIYSAKISDRAEFKKVGEFLNCHFVQITPLMDNPFTGLLATSEGFTDNSTICVRKIGLEEGNMEYTIDCKGRCKKLDSTYLVIDSFLRSNGVFYYASHPDIGNSFFIVDMRLNIRVIKLTHENENFVSGSAYCPALGHLEEMFVIEIIKDGELFLWLVRINEALPKAQPVSQIKSLKDHQPNLIFTAPIHGNMSAESKGRLMRMIYPTFSWIYVFGFKRHLHYGVGVYYHLHRDQNLPTECLSSKDVGIICNYSSLVGPDGKSHHLIIGEEKWKLLFGDWTRELVNRIDLVQCFMFNDCFGCKHLSPLFVQNYACSWSGRHCYSTHVPKYPDKCLRVISWTRSLWIGATLTEPGYINLTGFRLDNNFAQVQAKAEHQLVKTKYFDENTLMYDRSTINVTDQTWLELSVSITRKDFKSAVEKDSLHLIVRKPYVVRYLPTFGIDGHRMVLILGFNEQIMKIYSHFEASIGDSRCSNTSKAWDRTGLRFQCIFQSLNGSHHLQLTFGTYVVTSTYFKIKPRPVCDKVEPKAFINDLSQPAFTVYGRHLNNTYMGEVFVRLVKYHQNLATHCDTMLSDRFECEIEGLPEVDEERIVVKLRTHNFSLDRFCPITEVITVHAKPIFSEPEYDSQSQVVHFKAAHYILKFSVDIEIQGLDKRLISPCILIRDRSKGRAHQCIVNKTLNLENKMKALAYIGHTEYDMGFVDHLGAAERRRLIKNIIVGGVSAMVLVVVGLVCGAWYYQYTKRHFLKPHLRRLVNSRLLIRSSRFVPRIKSRERSEAKTSPLPEPASISTAGGASDLSRYFARAKVPAEHVQKVNSEKKRDPPFNLRSSEKSKAGSSRKSPSDQSVFSMKFHAKKAFSEKRR